MEQPTKLPVGLDLQVMVQVQCHVALMEPLLILPRVKVKVILKHNCDVFKNKKPTMTDELSNSDDAGAGICRGDYIALFQHFEITVKNVLFLI